MKVPALLFSVLFLASAHAGEPEPTVSVDRVREILAKARPHLVRLTGLAWPGDLVVEKTDVAGLAAVLAEEFDAQTRALHPELDASSRKRRVDFLSRAFARSLRAKYGLCTRKIHVSEGALSRLPEGVKADDVLTWIVLHETVHAMDDKAADLGALFSRAGSPEALRALRMVVEGRAEHYGALASEALGVPAETGRALEAIRSSGENLTRTAGRAFVRHLHAQGAARAVAVLRSPPTLTTAVLHPERYGLPVECPDPGVVLAGVAGGESPQPLSELDLRIRISPQVGRDATAEAFSGYLAGAALARPGGRRTSLVALTDEGAAARFMDCLRRVYGLNPGIADPVTTGVLPAGTGGSFRFALQRRGRWVAESLVGMDEDPVPPLDLLLDRAAEADAARAPGTPSPR